MTNRKGWGRCASPACWFILWTLAACNGTPNLVPASESARTALDQTLSAWRDGKSQAELMELDPPVQAVISDWAGGKKLSAYEVLREEPSPSDKRFTVKLTFAAPRAEVEERFVVLGARPIAVFRESDFDRGMNMDNNPTPKKKR